MPVIRYVPPDPTDIVVQDDQDRLGFNYVAENYQAPAPFQFMLTSPDVNAIHVDFILPGMETFFPDYGGDIEPTREVLRTPFYGTMIANNAVISTPCGALIGFDIGNHMMDQFTEHSGRWSLTGVTRDNTGATLGNCSVTVFETGRMVVGGAPIVGQTISDGSGNYTVEVSLNTLHEVIAYLAGSPDRAGISLRTLTPAAV